MRDPKRIDEFCRRLVEAWKNVPDWHFWQVVHNVETFAIKHDPFYMEDDEAIKIIEEYLRGY